MYNIVTDDLFIDQDRVLVVITFPGHKADQGILPRLISPLQVAGPSAERRMFPGHGRPTDTTGT